MLVENLLRHFWKNFLIIFLFCTYVICKHDLSMTKFTNVKRIHEGGLLMLVMRLGYLLWNINGSQTMSSELLEEWCRQKVDPPLYMMRTMK